MTTLITGGTGFVGRAAAAHVAEADGVGSVVLLDKYPDLEAAARIGLASRVIRGDILNFAELLAIMQQHHVTRIAHFAGAPGPPRGEEIRAYVGLQCVGTTNVFEAARRCAVRRIVNASSTGIFGVRHPEPVTEEVAPEPRTLYGASKLWSESLAMTYNQLWDMEIVSLRICASMGCGRLSRRSLDSGLTPRGHERLFITLPELAAIGEPIVMPPNDQELDVLHVRDAGLAWWLALSSPTPPPHAVYNLAAVNNRRSFGWMTARLRSLLPDAAITVSDQPFRVPQLLDGSRLANDLGFTPEFTPEAALDDYVNVVLAK
jgi:UDP-glucose 4-epimerase